ncbi:MAG: hypothetical protein KKF33_17760, partial [Alphaproteobacteria bacterium]|nr:hypothetical protein [Alphaproteobacteria bacterium]
MIMPHAISTKPHRVVIVLDPIDVRAWQIEVVRRLEAAGHTVGTECVAASDPASHRLDKVLNLEARRFGPSLASRTAPPPTGPQMDERDLVIDLTGTLMPQAGAPVLHLQFNGQRSFADGLTQIIASGSMPDITAFLDSAPAGVARPMLSDRLWLSRASNEILSGAIGLVEQFVARFFAGAITAVAAPEKANPVRGFWRHYVPALGRNVALRVYQKLRTRRPFYWQVAYRQVDGTDVAATTALDGAAFSVLPDDGQRFYADPFVVTRQGKTFLFVEEYPYATARGVISVAEQQADGSFGVPQVVLEEPYHLSYPQVFAHAGDMFMLPESGGARRLVLYRATAFPDQWVVDTVLVEGRDINDATLLERDGKYWLFATERRGAGSAS